MMNSTCPMCCSLPSRCAISMDTAPFGWSEDGSMGVRCVGSVALFCGSKV
jgi:hypothetical protein